MGTIFRKENHTIATLQSLSKQMTRDALGLIRNLRPTPLFYDAARVGLNIGYAIGLLLNLLIKRS
jgi:hypothetical protein